MMHQSYLEVLDKEAALAKKDSHDGHEGHSEEGGHSGFPLPFVLFFIGFSTMLLMDQVIFKASTLTTEEDSSDEK